MSRTLPPADEDGNILPELDPTSGVAQIIHLLEYGRQRGFRIGPTVQVGDTIVQVRDLRQEADAMRANDAPAEVDVWEAHGHKETGE